MPTKDRNQENKSLPKYWRLKNGTYSYRVPSHLREQHGGKGEISLGQSLSEAYRKFAEFFEIGNDLKLMRDLFDRYRLEVVTEHASKKTRSLKYTSLDRLRYVMGDNLVSIITPQAIYKYRDHIGRKHSQAIANQDLSTLSHCFTKAIEWGVIAAHPMTGKKVVKFSATSRNRYVEDWELQEWASVANPFLVVYVVLKGVTGLRQQDLLTIRKRDITETELISVNIKTGKKLRFPLFTGDGSPTTVKQALDIVTGFYAQDRLNKSKKKKPMVISPWLFHTRTGECYYNLEERKASGFQSIWQRSMNKALLETKLQVRFTEHDLRAKVGSDFDTDLEAQTLLAHASINVTKKHYRRKGSVVTPAHGFTLKG